LCPLLPPRSEAQLQVSLLQLYSRNLDEAWIELASVLEKWKAIGGSSGVSASDRRVEQGALLLEKIRLELMFKEDRL